MANCIEKYTYAQMEATEFLFWGLREIFSVQLEGLKLDTGSAGEGTLEEFTEWQYFSRRRFCCKATHLQSVVLAHFENICKNMQKLKDSNIQISLGGENSAAVGGVCPGREVVHPKQWAAVGGGRDYTHLRW